MSNIDINQIGPQLQIFLDSIQKAVGEDVRTTLQNTDLATNNNVRFIVSDYIHTNIRNCNRPDLLEPRKSKRYGGWEVIIYIDRVHKYTFSFCSKQTISKNSKNKDRKFPSYHQSLNSVGNAGLKPRDIQPDLFGYEEKCLFPKELLQEDYYALMGDDVSSDDGYRHLMVVYGTKNGNITSLRLMQYDELFNVIEELNIIDMLKPNLGDLTLEDGLISPTKKDATGLVSIKREILQESKDKESERVRLSAIDEKEERAN